MHSMHSAVPDPMTQYFTGSCLILALFPVTLAREFASRAVPCFFIFGPQSARNCQSDN